MKKYRFGEKENTWAIKTSDYTAVNGDSLIISTTGTVTITLPATPDDLCGIEIIKDNRGTVIISGNGKNIGSAANITFTSIIKTTVIYYSELGNWILNNSLGS